MNDNLPKKNLIFFTPGSPGMIFSLDQELTIAQLLHTQEFLILQFNQKIVYIEERRNNVRVPNPN